MSKVMLLLPRTSLCFRKQPIKHMVSIFLQSASVMFYFLDRNFTFLFLALCIMFLYSYLSFMLLIYWSSSTSTAASAFRFVLSANLSGVIIYCQELTLYFFVIVI